MTKRLPFLAAVISLLLATLAVAENKSITISDDSRPVIFLQKFVFTQTCHDVTISVSSSSSSSNQNSSRTGLYLVQQGSIHKVDIELQKNSSFCVLDSKYVHHLSQLDQSYPITGDYSLFFANCVPGAKVSMKFKTEIYNLDPNGSTQQPGLFFLFSLCFMTFFGLWVYFCYNKKQKILILIAALLLVKSLSLICAAEVGHYVKTTGTTPHGWNIPFYVFQFLEKVLLYVVIWSFLKLEKKLLMMVILFHVIGTIGSIVGGESGSYIQNWSPLTHISSSSSMKLESTKDTAFKSNTSSALNK